MLFQTYLFCSSFDRTAKKRIWIKIQKCILNATTFNCRWQKFSILQFETFLVRKYTPHFLSLKAKRIMQYTVYSSTQLLLVWNLFLGFVSGFVGMLMHRVCLFMLSAECASMLMLHYTFKVPLPHVHKHT